MLRFWIVLLLALPFIDLYVLIQATSVLGFWQVIALVLITGLVGAELIRREGIHVLKKLQRSVTGGEVSRNMLEGGIIIFSGLMLLTPGFISDILGFTLILRPLRERIVVKLTEGSKNSFHIEVRQF